MGNVKVSKSCAVDHSSKGGNAAHYITGGNQMDRKSSNAKITTFWLVGGVLLLGGIIILANCLFCLGVAYLNAVENLNSGGASIFGWSALGVGVLLCIAASYLSFKTLKKSSIPKEDLYWGLIHIAAIVAFLSAACVILYALEWNFGQIVYGSQVIISSLFANESGWRGHVVKFLSAVNISFNLLLVLLIIFWGTYELRTGITWGKYFSPLMDLMDKLGLGPECKNLKE